MQTAPCVPIDAPMTGPPDGTLERWCWNLVLATRLEHKLEPALPPPLDACESWEARAVVRRLCAPGRPPELIQAGKTARSVGAKALTSAAARAQLVHSFAHHELQAAELFAWAVLAFPETPREFRAGLVRLALDELRHMQLYIAHLAQLGLRFGERPVRDWFWQRVIGCRSPAAFVALQGLGLEGANLEHSARAAQQFRAAGDAAGASILERVGAEEIAHVRFARGWFEHFSGKALDYDTWSAALPAPLTPSVLRGEPLNIGARRLAGFDSAFLERLAAAPPTGRARQA